jgi:hypothetical protein
MDASVEWHKAADDAIDAIFQREQGVTDMIAEQTVLAQGLTLIFGKAGNEKGTPCAQVACSLLEGPDKGQTIEYVGWITEATEARTAESLALFGYDGENATTITRNKVALVIEHEDYTTNAGASKKRARVKWVNDPARAGAKFDALEPAMEIQLKSRLKGLMLAQAAAKPAKPADADKFDFGANQKPAAGPQAKF